MSIIMFLGKDVEEYKNESKPFLQEALMQGKLCCELCLGLFKYHSEYQRYIKETGEKISITIVYCKGCNNYHAVLPDFLLPHKHYSANEIEAVVIDSGYMPISKIDTEAGESTVRRWKKQINERLGQAVSILKALFMELYGAISELYLEADTTYDELVKLLSFPPQNPMNSKNMLGLANLWLGKFQKNVYI